MEAKITDTRTLAESREQVYTNITRFQNVKKIIYNFSRVEKYEHKHNIHRNFRYRCLSSRSIGKSYTLRGTRLRTVESKSNFHSNNSKVSASTPFSSANIRVHLSFS